MRTIIATIKPEHLNNIRRGVKTLEIRKTAPELPFRVLCCESGSKGQIKAEFVCEAIYPVDVLDNGSIQNWVYHNLERAKISYDRMTNYIGHGKRGWAWCITNMIDYCSTKGQRVRNISEFGLKRAPQSWQYVVEEKPEPQPYGSKLIRTPCMPGEVVYYRDFDADSEKSFVRSMKVECIEVTEDGFNVWCKDALGREDFDAEDFGYCIFLTMREALE